MWKKFLMKLSFLFLDLAFNLIFKSIDKNKDGKLSKTELKEFTDRVIRKLRAFR